VSGSRLQRQGRHDGNGQDGCLTAVSLFIA
jgi:hypothetical protein